MYLQIDQIACGYGRRPILTSLSLTVERGDFIAVVGPNGSGKSTLIKAISGVLPVRAGRIALLGQDLRRLTPKALARQVAVVSQETAVEFEFTVEEIVMMGRLPHLGRFRGETEADHAAVRRALEETDTLHLKDRVITGLSGGERQRVIVARALAQEPSLLLLDEPTAHLDIAHQVELLDLIRRLNRENGLTVVAVLHDLNLASQYSNRMLMIRDGERFALGAPSDVITEANIAAVYGCRVQISRHPEEGTPHVILLGGAGLPGRVAATI